MAETSDRVVSLIAKNVSNNRRKMDFIRMLGQMLKTHIFKYEPYVMGPCFMKKLLNAFATSNDHVSLRSPPKLTWAKTFSHPHFLHVYVPVDIVIMSVVWHNRFYVSMSRLCFALYQASRRCIKPFPPPFWQSKAHTNVMFGSKHQYFFNEKRDITVSKKI